MGLRVCPLQSLTHICLPLWGPLGGRRMANPEQVVTECLPSDRSSSLTTGQGLCCGSSHYGCSAMKPSTSARPPTVWERSTPVPSSRSWKVSAREGHGTGGVGGGLVSGKNQPASSVPALGWCVCGRKEHWAVDRDGRWIWPGLFGLC